MIKTKAAEFKAGTGPLPTTNAPFQLTLASIQASRQQGRKVMGRHRGQRPVTRTQHRPQLTNYRMKMDRNFLKRELKIKKVKIVQLKLHI